MSAGYFSFSQRDNGHWDVSDGTERVFAIRGEPGAVFVRDERKNGPPFPRKSIEFFSVETAALWIASQLMWAADHD